MGGREWGGSGGDGEVTKRRHIGSIGGKKDGFSIKKRGRGEKVFHIHSQPGIVKGILLKKN